MLLANKTAVVVGVANEYSIAWAIAQELAAQGARLLLTFQNERLQKPVEKLAATLPNAVVAPCDVTVDAEIAAVFDAAAQTLGRLDMLVHSVAFAKREDLGGRIIETTREGFQLAQDISAYSLLPLARHAAPLMQQSGGGSIVAMTYLGGVKVVPNYNLMGLCKATLESAVRYLAWDLGPHNIRVNGLSAGPIKTMAARGITGFSQMLEGATQRAPLRRNVTAAEVGKAALFLLSDLASGVTGHVLYVDAGYHIMGA